MLEYFRETLYVMTIETTNERFHRCNDVLESGASVTRSLGDRINVKYVFYSGRNRHTNDPPSSTPFCRALLSRNVFGPGNVPKDANRKESLPLLDGFFDKAPKTTGCLAENESRSNRQRRRLLLCDRLLCLCLK